MAGIPRQIEPEIYEGLKRNPDLLQRVLVTAVDAAWGYIECASLRELEGDTEWMDTGSDFDDIEDDLRLLLELGLAEVHKDHPAWVRQIATI